MLKNYIKIAFRNLYRNKAYSFINILGLTLGITCSSLLFLFVIDELSFDNFHGKQDQIYRVVEVDDSEQGTEFYGETAPPLGSTLVRDYSQVNNYTSLLKFNGHIDFLIEDVKHSCRDYYMADENFLDVFDFELLLGDANTALDKPFSLLIDEGWASRLFGDQNPVGKEVVFQFDKENPYTIMGVFKNTPQNSHLKFEMLYSYPPKSGNFGKYLLDWKRYGAYTYLILDTDLLTFSKHIPDIITKYFGDHTERNFYLQPLSEIHFGSSDIEYGTDTNKGQIAYIYIFIAIGVFMLLIACINYMNLATAKSMHRGKEIGMRKVSGATKNQLVTQFLSESTLIALISFVFSIGLVDLLLPYFNQITDRSFVFNMETFSGIFGLLLLITLAVGLLSGSYPALLMSKLHPASILKGDMNTGKGSLALRKILVITQFSLSIIMIIATVVATKQMDFIQNSDLGFDKSQVLVVDINNGNVRERFETMKTEFAKSPYIKQVATSSRVPGEWKSIAEVYVSTLDEVGTDSLRTFYIGFDKDMIATYDIKLLKGSNFSGKQSLDSLTILLNEKAVKVLGLVDPIGTNIELTTEDGKGQYRVIGVVKDFNFQSLHNEIAPMIIGYQSNNIQSIDYFSMKIDGAHTQEVLAHASSVHNMFDTNTVIEYHFLDKQWSQFYQNDDRAGNIFMIGAGITILIACLGLFGLASFIIQKRTKEIGVRKVLGASIPQLFLLLSKTFVVQVGVAFLIAVPISWYFMSSWLNNFAFKFDLGISEFALAGISALLIAILSVSYRVLKASLLNPARTLKDE